MKHPFPSLVLALLFCFSSNFLRAADGDILPPEKQLAKWYGQHLHGKSPFLDRTRREFWPFMFGTELQKVLKKKELGFDPFLFAQDSEIKDLAIKRIDSGDHPDALVLVTFTNFGKRIALVAAMKISDHGWRLINIVEPDDGQSLLE